MKSQSNPYLSMTARNEHQAKVLEGVGMWAAYYRSNIHRFAMDYLHVNLKLFQMILLVMMNLCTTFVFIGFRGIGKSFICAIFCCARCILYPGQTIRPSHVATYGQTFIELLEHPESEVGYNVRMKYAYA